ncbi:uncharacterized protein F4807DRAFT_168597 [Annulohypoxylon truncatum]|uniref:uncharacterized protein n=1 Tax=Annulohypoxylon truncatum TaxID=327061 RepID=UPI0020076D1C|nr:uncharacterized protein F4807DRAFT_168597 [Annulohypoxylon truncatum]KAI1207865.1 hypothetical protein F4807DRAFT_168597 [Annulohypoxylon truncatum]
MTCLSPDDHGCDIKDHLLHFLGCIKIKDREDFFEPDHGIWKQELEHQKEHLGLDDEQAHEVTRRKRESWKDDCDGELRRINFLRKTLRADKKDKHLVKEVNSSRERWQKKKGKNVTDSTTDGAEEVDEYEPEKDISAPIILFENGRGADVPIDDKKSKDGRRVVWNKFPNQKTALSDLLRHEKNFLHNENFSSDRLGYFHVPSNNMIWAEHAISRYFGEERPDYHATQRELNRKKKTRAYMVLRDQYWKSQLHGGQQHIPPHARHLRPLCETVSSDPDNADYFPRNMVLFMPYLHWDISRRSEQFAMEIADIMEDAKDSPKHDGERKRELRRERNDDSETSSSMGEAAPDGKSPKPTIIQTLKQKFGLGAEQPTPADNCFAFPEPGKHRRTKARIYTMGRLLKELKLIESRLPVDGNGRVRVRNALGQYLLDAARLYEGMSNYRDKKLLRKYLCADPPLHPRRTLDQAYHWTLNSTWHRDRDQVVYRHTTTKPEDFHKYNHNKRVWEDHEEFGIKGQCEECKMNIKKLSRVVMVDQLWMWILDAKTIITCFPKRYGANKQDTSAIHKSIRVHLQDNSGDQIRTVFDLALVIIDECSNTFFDRTKTGDRQPLVLDAFSKAIGNIMQKQTAAFERLWRWTDEASEIYRSNTNGDTSGLHVPLLDINPEGQLEREIKDIIEELDIMIHITNIHKKILTAFIANAENILDPFGDFAKNKKRQMISRYLWDKSEKKPDDLAALREAINRNDCNDPKLKKMQDDYHWFKLNADERLVNVEKRIEELKDLRRSAKNTADDVKDLLGLKQQQAGVVQAWQAVKQSEETIKQGRSIMMFTLVTIVFLPLSFMSSIFGMNNSAITSDTSIQLEFVYMFSISAGVIFISLFLAFGSWIRAGVFYIFKWLMTWLLVNSGIYRVWLDINWPSKRLHTEANEYSDRLKKNAKIANLERRRKRRERDEERAQRNDKNKSKNSLLQFLQDPSSYEDNAKANANGNSTSVRNERDLLSMSQLRKFTSGARGEKKNDLESGEI